jgi:hypothetical protein
MSKEGQSNFKGRCQGKTDQVPTSRIQHQRKEPRATAERPDDRHTSDRLSIKREERGFCDRVEPAELAGGVGEEACIGVVSDGEEGETQEESRGGAGGAKVLERNGRERGRKDGRSDDEKRGEHAETVQDRPTDMIREVRVDLLEVLFIERVSGERSRKEKRRTFANRF